MKLSKAARAEFQRVGALGGKARAANLSKAKRVAQAKHAAVTRWQKKLTPATNTP